MLATILRHPFLAYALVALIAFVCDEILRRRDRARAARRELARRWLGRWQAQSRERRVALDTVRRAPVPVRDDGTRIMSFEDAVRDIERRGFRRGAQGSR